MATPSMPAPAEPLAPLADDPATRRFTGQRKVRLGDVDPSGRLRLDALTRYTQDVSDDDTTDVQLPDVPGWVVRSTVVDELSPAAMAEGLIFTTYCSGLGKRWAERRLTIVGDRGARYEVATIWVCIDHETGRPHPLTDEFRRHYEAAAAGRTVSARLRNPTIDDVPAAEIERRRWPLRRVDYDIYEHVNNAAYWAAVEEWCQPASAGPRRIRLEYGAGVSAVDAVTIAAAGPPDNRCLWWLDGPGPSADGVEPDQPTVLASAAVEPLPADLYG